MRLSSKSIQSPAHTSDNNNNNNNSIKSSQNHSLSSSLSRRLRHNRSLRGGAQSPAMFPSKKNRGSSGFAENPEPSSPKVTCIGQVRVKTKKQGKKMKMRACRSKRLSGGGGSGNGGGEVSFRRIEHSQEGLNQSNQQQTTQDCGLNHRNQRWVHLPLTICEALRAFGSEFSCLFPCKSSCFSSGICGGEKGEKERGESSANSCAVFRWLVSLQEGDDEGKRRDIELVVGGEEEEEVVVEREVGRERVMMERECSRRRSIFDDMEFDDLFHNANDNKSKSGEIIDGSEDEEEGGRVSVCIPPKNALLLMRCRSDPMKMASLSRKLWDPPLPQDDDNGVDNVDDEDEVEEAKEDVVKVEDEVENEEEEEEKTEVIEDKAENEEMDEMLEEDMVVSESNAEILPDFAGEEEQIHEEEQKETEEEKQETEQEQSMENRGNSEHEKCEIAEETQVIEDEIIANRSSIESINEEEKVEDGENEQDLLITNLEEEQELELENGESNSTIEEEKEGENAESSELSTITSSTSSCLNSSEESTAESKQEEEQEEEKVTVQCQQEREKVVVEEERRLSMEEKPKEENKSTKLPDCLLLMMCEPKLSMEVSKETWVCSTDFIRWLPERHQSKKSANTKTDGSDESTTKKKKPTPVVGPPAEPPVQQGRSSISFPAGSVANLIEKKLVKAGGYEPFVLTRCKSAPIRPTAKIAAPEMTCGRKLEPHRPATFGVGF
ncbi:hypothetical protein RDABS01_032757 [Bienertia sinuspersici]